jgi:hypothetical protein
MSRLGGAVVVLVLGTWLALFFQVLDSNGENKLVFVFLSVPIAIVVLLIFLADWMWRSHQRKQQEQQPLRDVPELVRRDPPR